ncbi:MAG: hypothetical protein KA184_13250 [Candidatus Hydrogenedentes bacterium]|nr:hypothetical protein [Candidatus Hydrogenedentota bacterium]
MRAWLMILAAGLALVLLQSGVLAQESASTSDGGIAPKAEDLLFVTQDESSAERSIEAYLKRVLQWNARVDYIGDNRDDMILHYDFAKDPECPGLSILIDTQPSNRGSSGETVERAIQIRTYYILPDSLKTPEHRAELLEMNNTFLQEVWPVQVYLDTDNDIAFQCTINIPNKSVPVHMNMVADRMARMLGCFCDFFERLQKKFPDEIKNE